MNKIRLIIFWLMVTSLVGIVRLVFSQEKRELKYFGVNYRDPFSSFLPQEKPVEVVEKVNPPDLKLQGMVWGSDKPRAIINGTVLGKGDKIQEAEILTISKEGVEFVYKDHVFFLDRISGTIKEKTE
ncbi:MAG: general secretion pathway protein GspB [Candidatus Omnitrophica bacterium]|nr:general secretion pathway protein GspB [Candidatus Omnitrophota bacterium]